MSQIIDTGIRSINKLIDGLLNYADTFSFSIRDDNGIGHKAKNLIANLTPHLANQNKTREWPGTILLLDQATVYVYYLNQESASILKEYNDDIHQWIHPEMPEDLIFYKDGKPIFISITHEKDAYFVLEDGGLDLQLLQGLITPNSD